MPRPCCVETARVGRIGIVAFPNFAHWPNRLAIARGRMPVTKRLPYQWYDTPNIRVGTFKDFEVLATKNRLRDPRCLRPAGRPRGALPAQCRAPARRSSSSSAAERAVRSRCCSIRASGIQPPGSSQIDGVPSKRWQLHLGVLPWTPHSHSISPEELGRRARPARRAARARRSPRRALWRKRTHAARRAALRARGGRALRREHAPRRRDRLLRPWPRSWRAGRSRVARAPAGTHVFCKAASKRPGSRQRAPADVAQAARTWASPASGPRAGSRASGRRSTASPVPGWCGDSSIRRAEFFYVPTRPGVRRGEAAGRGRLRHPRRADRARWRALQLRRAAARLRPAGAGAARAGAHRARRRHRPAGSGAAMRPGCWRSRWACRALHGDDHAMLQPALPVYDALYAWCRERQRRSARLEPRDDERARRRVSAHAAARAAAIGAQRFLRRGAEVLAQARLHQLRRAGRPDRDHASRAGRAEALDLRAALPACAELLHAAARTRGAAARHLHRLADAPHLGRHRGRRAVRAALAVHPDRAELDLRGVRRSALGRGRCSTASSRRWRRSCCRRSGGSAAARSRVRAGAAAVGHRRR